MYECLYCCKFFDYLIFPVSNEFTYMCQYVRYRKTNVYLYFSVFLFVYECNQHVKI